MSFYDSGSLSSVNSPTKYRAIVTYDGTSYNGWQAQKNLPSIESTLKAVFKRSFGVPVVSLVAASRTDAGVHANGQVLLFKHILQLDPDKLLKIMNDHLPFDIHFKSVCYALPNFHPWYNVSMKEYHYLFSFDRPLPMYSRFIQYVRASFDIERFKEALRLFVGTYNFSQFATDSSQKSTAELVKKIDSITVEYDSNIEAWRIRIQGKSFLRHMIRRIVGAAAYVAGKNQDGLSCIEAALYHQKRVVEFPTAHACGLVLESVFYHERL